MNRHHDIVYPSTVPFVLAHIACFAAISTGVYATDVAIAVGLYVARMFGITAGYHRYFSHRAFSTSRWFQFVLAFLAMSSAQRGVLWWAANHRHHHRYSDTPLDVHSPVQDGFWYSHVGWIFDRRFEDHNVDLSGVKDLTAYPELVWLNKYYYVPPVLLAIAVYALAGPSGLIVGFFWSTVALFHGTFFINSLAHVQGRRVYVTGDESRNNWFLALITMGEGWHNNHHYFQSSARQGYRWWQVDLTYYILVVLSWFGVVRDLKQPPASVLAGDRRISGELVERARMILTDAEARWDAFAERTLDLLHQASAQKSQVAARATAALEQVAISRNEVAARAAEALAQMAESGHEMAEQAMEAMARIAASGSEAADRAREALARMAASGGELAAEARRLLAELADPDAEPLPA